MITKKQGEKMKEHSNLIPSILGKYPRAGLLKTPLLIHRLPKLSSYVGYNIHILRDDLTGFAQKDFRPFY